MPALSLWQRWIILVDPLEVRLLGSGPRAAIATTAVMLLVVAVTPFALFYGYGPARFEEPLTLGAVPADVQVEELPTFDDLSPVPSADVVPEGVDRLNPDVPLDLGPNVRVTLLFSVGSRAITDSDAERLRVNDPDERGADGLTDVVMLVLADPDSGRVGLLSIPRDYYLQSRDDRINATWVNGGTQDLVDVVSDVTGLPIHHVALVNFTAFADLVDELGGVAMRAEREMADLESNLYVPAAGCWAFDGASALAWVRSRNTLTSTASGGWVRDVSGSDFGRIARQQQLLAAAFDQLRGPSAITKIPDLLNVARSGLVIDRALDLQAVRELAGAFLDVRAGTFEGYTIPSNIGRRGERSVVIPDQEASRPIIERLRQWPPADPLSVPVDVPPVDSEVGDPGEVQVDEACTMAMAAPLPHPAAPLAEVAASRPRSATPTPTPTTTSRPSRPSPPRNDPPASEEPPATPTPTTTPSETAPEPTPTSEPTPTDEPSPAPTTEPSDEPTTAPEPSPTPEDSESDDPGGLLP